MADHERDPVVLIHAPGRDRELTCRVLGEAGFACHECLSEDELVALAGDHPGALLLAEEMLVEPLLQRLQHLIQGQPAWSDVPVLVVAQRGERRGLLSLAALGNVSVLTRPMALDALTSAVRAALRARQRQFEVRDLLEQQREQARRKDHFLAMLAHELRNPLAPIRYAAHAMQLPAPEPDKIASLASVIERQVGHMGRIIDQLLDVSRITRGMIRLHNSTLDVAQLARDTVAAHSMAAAAKDVLLQGQAVGPLWVDGDQTRLKQVLDNLVDNAIKFSPPGSSVQVDAAEQDGHAVLRVIDRGDGISPEVLPFLFEPFTQADTSLDRSRGGLGLGLALVKGLTEMHGGRVAVASEGPGQGSVFSVRLPLSQRPQRERQAQRREQDGPEPLRVLVAEDNVDAAEALQIILESSGYRVWVAHSGPAAVETALRVLPDVLVCDIGLPGMSGYEVAKSVQSAGVCARLRVAVTGYATPEDRAAAMSAGFDVHFPKPVAPTALLDALRGLTRPAATAN